MRAMNADKYMIPEFQLTVHGEYETGRLAAAIARLSVAGDLIRLEGELGAGKSAFSRHYLTALGHKGEVPSPTYTLVQAYADTRFPVAHVDCYRMKEPAEMDGLGLEEYRKYGIILCEWPEKGSRLVREGQPDFLDYHINTVENPGTLTLKFETLPQTEHGRVVTLRGSTSWQRRFGFLARLGIQLPVIASRPVDDEGRRAFLERSGVKNYTIESLGGDWSARSYWRVKLENGEPRMLMDAPPPQEGVTEYAQVAHYYREIGLRAAKTYAGDDTEGYLLSEDFGDKQLWHLVKDGEAHTEWYKAVADGVMTLCHQKPPVWARPYHAKSWWVEVARFVNWYLPFARGRATTLEEYAQWQAMWAPLHERVMKMPTGLMMWDCQSPNLMVLGDKPKLENIGWIDIQDARVAPLCQDLGHLLRNIRSPQDDAREKEVLDYVAQRMQLDRAELQTCIEICNLHNACRLIGGLTRILVRDGKIEGPKNFLERTWEVARQSYGCPELQGIVEVMRDAEAPGMARLWKEASKTRAA
ncbi:MAG: tRNA (adenosine(37)-N6)-threonylcarbamoyltransferase complex ATPase subunit type 1 TsaE [Proteobacteria bacterium]|nr:tRNA (adenosine(37)-N6)-threonylcarbamoyltransferase complex ATPase subunit type 1 TsaE [Pseudomonadota bacterium]